MIRAHAERHRFHALLLLILAALGPATRSATAQIPAVPAPEIPSETVPVPQNGSGYANRPDLGVPSQPPAVTDRGMPKETVPVLQHGPGSAGWPGLATPSQPPPPPTVLEEERPSGKAPPPLASPIMQAPPPYVPPADQGEPIRALTDDQWFGTYRNTLQPLPGSLDEAATYWHEARRGFQVCTWRGTEITSMPYGLLWEPALASKREPRMLVNPTSFNNARGNWTLDTSIGTTVGLFRFKPIGHDIAFQFDIAGVVHTRLTPDDLDAADYRFGLPLSMRWGSWHGKLAYEHTSAHLGDEFLRRNPTAQILAFAKDEAVIALGRWIGDRVRLYGQYSYAMQSDLPFGTPDKARHRFDVGTEIYCPAPTGIKGQPFFAVNLDTRGDQDFNANVNVQAGWMWRNPYQRLSNVRLFGEYYNGNSPFNQFYLTKETFYSVGLSCDY